MVGYWLNCLEGVYRPLDQGLNRLKADVSSAQIKRVSDYPE